MNIFQHRFFRVVLGLLMVFNAASTLFIAVQPVHATPTPDEFKTENVDYLPTASMSDVAYGNGIYVAVGSYGSIIVSNDADTWVNAKTKANNASYTGVTKPSQFSFNTVAFGNGTFIVGGSEGVILTSTDGMNWTQRTALDSSTVNEIRYLTFNGVSSFYAISTMTIPNPNPSIPATIVPTLRKSTDGTTWSNITVTGFSSTYMSHIIVGENGTKLALAGWDGAIYYTTNGTTWTKKTSNASPINEFEWIKDKYCISDGAAKYFTSTDLNTFTQRTIPARISTMTYDGTTFYGFGEHPNYQYGGVMTSTDGITWSLQQFESFFVPQNSYYANGKYFRVGNEGLQVSSTGSNWQYKWGGTMYDMIYDGTKYVAVGALGGEGAAWTSTNLSEWTPATFSAYTKYYKAVAYGNSKYVAVGDTSTYTYVATSTNGTSWTTNTSAITDGSYLADLAFGNGKFVTVGSYYPPGSNVGVPMIRYSTDGTTWTKATLPTNSVDYMVSVQYVNNKFFAFGYNYTTNNSNLILTSTDGVTWTDLTSSYPDSTDQVLSIVYDSSQSKYMIVGMDASWNNFSRTTTTLTSWSSATTMTSITNPYVARTLSIQNSLQGNKVYLLGMDSATYSTSMVYFSDDLGATWQDTGMDLSAVVPYGLASVNNQTVVMGANKLVKTTNLSSNAKLGSLTSSEGLFDRFFASNVTTYTDLVPNATSSVTFTPTVDEPHATVKMKVNGGAYSTVTSGSATSSVNLNEGSNTIQFLVSAQNGTTTKTYTITMVRNHKPTFIGSASFNVLPNAAATDVKSVLHVSDSDSAQPLTWTQTSAPQHGTLALSSATATSGSSDVTPGGTITYQPTNGYTGTDSFTIEVSDGTDTSTRTVSVNVSNITNAATPTITTQPTNVTADRASTASVSVSATVTDSGTLSYQWYSNTTNSASGGTAINGATSATYTIPTTNAGTFYYYVVVTNTNNSVNGTKTATVTSNVATAVINALTNAATPTITTQPSNKSVGLNGAATLTVAATTSDSGTLSYQWYSNATNSTSGGTIINGATSTSYSAPTASVGTKYYYAIVKNTNNSVNGTKIATVTTTVASVVVSSTTNAATPAITTQPSNKSVNLNGVATLTVTATTSDSGTLSYQWYSNTTNSTSGGTAISGATNASYTAPTTSTGTKYYYVIVKNTNNSVSGTKVATVTSNVASVVVSAGDTTAPIVTGVTATKATTIGVTVNAVSNENATVYYVITTSATAPSKAQITTGKISTGVAAEATGSGAVTANNPATFDETGLNPKTAYYVYLVAKDAAGNISLVMSTTFTTSFNNANLSSLTISAGALTPYFKSSITEYAITVSSKTTSVTFKAVTSDPYVKKVEIRINGGTYQSITSGVSTPSLALNTGNNTVEIRVTTLLNSTKTYTVVVTRLK